MPARYARPLIVSLCDFSGNWPHYFRLNGYRVIQVDIQRGRDVLNWIPPKRAFGVLAAPPCTDFSNSGAQYWREKDADGRTARSVRIVERCLELIDAMRPEFWLLENPVGRLGRWLGPPRCYVEPWHYAGYAPDPETDRYTKKTGLWGEFRLARPKPRDPIRACAAGSWMMSLSGQSPRTQELRSRTPLGLARATYLGNRLSRKSHNMVAIQPHAIATDTKRQVSRVSQ